jgi:ACS family tartrate transporter-like MFS transporter
LELPDDNDGVTRNNLARATVHRNHFSFALAARRPNACSFHQSLERDDRTRANARETWAVVHDSSQQRTKRATSHVYAGRNLRRRHGASMDNREREKRIVNKVTLHLIPFLCACFMAAFLDRVNVGFAKEQMITDLGLSNAVYGFGAGIFFFGYFLFEVPSNLILARVGARLWIARIMIVWGVISAAMILARGPTSFYVLRFLLGAAEAGFFPGVIYYMTHWFPSAYRSRTVAVFMTAAVVSNIVGSPLSGLLLELDGAIGLRGYKWLFLVEALPSIALGVLVFLRLPAGPRDAAWLDRDDAIWLEQRLLAERQVADEHKMTLRQAFTDPRVLLLAFVYFTHVIGGYGLDFFQPTLVKLAFPAATPKLVGLINAVPAFVAAFVMNIHGRSSDRRGERKLHFAAAVWWAAGGLILASLPVPPALALAALALAVSGRWSSVAPFWGLSTAFLSGTAAAGAIALINAVGNLGGFAGPYVMGWLKDATGDYRIGLRILGATMFAGGLLALTVRVRKEAGSASTEADLQPSLR